MQGYVIADLCRLDVTPVKEEGVMIKSAESAVVARPAEDVFSYVADLRNEPSWHVDIASVPPETDPVPVVGKTYALKFKPFMYTVEPVGGGTRFTRAVEMRPSGLKVLMTPMMMFMVPRRNKVFVQNLKRALES